MLKNFEKLNGFYIDKFTPIEMLYSKDMELKGYTFLTERKNYPYPMYVKLNLDFDMEEFYPWKLSNTSDKKSVKTVIKNLSFNTDQAYRPNSYFSVNANNLKIEDFYVEHHILKKFEYKSMTLKSNYYSYNNLNRLKDFYSKTEDEEDKKFIKKIIEKNPNYAFAYINPETNHIKKFLIGFSFGTDEHLRLYRELNLHDIILKSMLIAENST